MKLFKLFLLGLVFLFSLNVVSAVINENDVNTRAYYNFSNAGLDATGRLGTLTASGTPNTVTGIIGDGKNFDGTENYDAILDPFNAYPFSMNIWYKTNHSSGGLDNVAIAVGDASTANVYYGIGMRDGQVRTFKRNGGGQFSAVDTVTTNDGNWHMMTGVFVSDALVKLYVDGVNVANDTNSITYNNGVVDQTAIGQNADSQADQFWFGNLDEGSFWNKSVTQEEINQLYNGGAAFGWNFAPVIPSIAFDTINLTNNSFINSSSLDIFVNITTTNTNNDTYINYTLDSGTPTVCATLALNCTANLTSLSDGLHNISFYAWNNETNTTSANYYFTVDTINPGLNVTALTESILYTFNFTNTINFSDTNLDTCLVTTDEGKTTVCTNSSYTFLTNGNHTFNVTVNDSAGNINSSLNNIIFVNPNQCHNFFNTNNGTAITSYTFGGTSFSSNPACFKTFNEGLVFGSNTLEFAKIGFATTNVTFNLTNTSSINESINITQSTIAINIYDSGTLNLLTGLTTLTLIPPLSGPGANSSTTTGQVNISNVNFISGAYQIIATHTNYSTESVYFTYDNQQLLNIDIYMLNLSKPQAGFVIIRAVSDSGPLIQGAVCKALEWVSSQSAFVAVSQGLTDTNGEAIVNVDIGTELYKFTCEKAGQLVTSPQQIPAASGITIPLTFVTVEEAPIISLSEFQGNLTNVTINSSYQQIIYKYNDPLGTVTEACIKVYKKTGTQKILQSETCSASSTGEIQIALNINNTFNLQVEATAAISSTEIVVDILKFGKIGNFEAGLKALGLHLIVPILFLCLGLALGLMVSPPSIMISGIGGIAGVWIAGLILPSIISFSIALFISIILGLMIIGSDKRK